MRSLTLISRATVLGALLCGAGVLHAADDYAARKDAIDAQYKTDRQTCSNLSGNAKDICAEEAQGKQKVARAELDAARDPSPRQQEKLAEARADATYEVAKERCDDLAGNAKDVCVKDAKAARTRTVADAKATRTTAGARADARDEKSEAQYKAAVERCDTLAGDAKDACVTAAKTRHGQ